MKQKCVAIAAALALLAPALASAEVKVGFLPHFRGPRDVAAINTMAFCLQSSKAVESSAANRSA